MTTTLPPGGSTTTTTLAPPPPLPPTSQQLIADALRDGRIDRPTALRYRAYALFGDDRLPAEFDGDGTTGEDTLLFLEILRRWGELSAEVQADLQAFLARPTDPQSIFYPKAGGAPAGLAMAAAEPVAVECPFAPGAGTPDWRPTEPRTSSSGRAAAATSRRIRTPRAA